MYLIYLDESENSNKNKKNSLELNIFGLTGILVTSRYITSLVDEFIKIKENNGIPEAWEIHGFEIFSGSGKWSKKFSEEARRKICRDFIELVAKKGKIKKIWFCYKESTLIKKDYIESLRNILNESINCVGRGKGSGKQLLVIFDEKDDLKREINEFIIKRRNEINLKKKKTLKKVCRVIDHGFPGKSMYSEILQLTDFVGYILRLSKTIRRSNSLFSRKQDQRFIDFVDSLVKKMKGKFHETKIKTLKNP